MFGFLLLTLVAIVAFFLIRGGAKTSTAAFVLTGLFVPVSIAFAAWFLASPPIWTLFAPRLEATIQIADVPDANTNNQARALALRGLDVRVRLDRERSGRLLPLYGVQEPPRGEYSGRIDYQNALRDTYPIGSAITVRYAGDVTYVDEQDWFTTILFVFCVVFALLTSIIAIIVSNARAGSRVKPPPG